MNKITKKVLLFTLSLSILAQVSPISNARLPEKKSVQFTSSFGEKGTKSQYDLNFIDNDDYDYTTY